MREQENKQMSGGGQGLAGLPCNVFLIGFMGSGKSTTARMLGSLTGADIVEMDEEIERKNGMTVSEIFQVKGEPYFRQEETDLLVRRGEGDACIVSCGGGVAMRQENVDEMRRSGRIVLLVATPETILERVRDTDDRPLLRGKKNVKDISELMEQRRGRYEAAADIRVITDNRSPEDIAREILDRLN